MRNVAGHPQTAFKDILVLDTFLQISEIVVMHHTGSYKVALDTF